MPTYIIIPLALLVLSVVALFANFAIFAKKGTAESAETFAATHIIGMLMLTLSSIWSLVAGVYWLVIALRPVLENG